MRHSQPKSSSRTSRKQRISRGRRSHQLVYRPQHSRTYGQRAGHRPERRRSRAKRLEKTPSRSSVRWRDQSHRVTENFRRESREKTHRSRERKNSPKKGKKETSHRDHPKKSSKRRKIREWNKILDRLASEIEEKIRKYKEDQLSKILSRDIDPERDFRTTPPAQFDSE